MKRKHKIYTSIFLTALSFVAMLGAIQIRCNSSEHAKTNVSHGSSLNYINVTTNVEQDVIYGQCKVGDSTMPCQRGGMNIEMENTLKPVIFSDSTDDSIAPENFMVNAVQKTIPYNPANYGICSAAGGDFLKADRAENWQDLYKQKSYLAMEQQNIPDWGIVNAGIRMNSDLLWKNGTKLTESPSDMRFLDTNGEVIWHGGKEIPSGKAITSTNTLQDAYGMFQTFLLSQKIANLIMGGENLYFLTGDGASSGSFSASEPIQMQKYSLSNMFSINDGNYKNKSLKIGLKDSFVLRAHDDSTVSSTLQNMFGNCEVTINFKVADEFKSDIMVNKSLTFPFNNYDSSGTIYLNPNQNGDYPCAINSVSISSIANSNVYVAESHVDNIDSSVSNVALDKEGEYQLTKAKAKTCVWQPYDTDKISDMFLDDITDENIFTMFIKLYDEYGNIIMFSDLNSDDYYFTRNIGIGFLSINMYTIDGWVNEDITNFKIPSNKESDVDASCFSSTIAQDLDKDKILDILVSNGYDREYEQKKEFFVINKDNENGNAIVCSQGNTIGTNTFTIFNLRPYYISQNTNLPDDILKKKPSEISNSIFLANFINMSEEFKNRNIAGMDIDLNSNDSASLLTAKIRYVENSNNEIVELTYKYNLLPKDKVSYLSITLYVLSAIFGMATIWFIYKNIKKKKKKQDDVITI